MMKKKSVCILLLAFAGIGAAFAQEKPAAAAETSQTRKNIIAFDLFPLSKGLIASDSSQKASYFCTAASYERLVAPHFSIGADFDLYFGSLGDISGNYFSLAAEGRYYPQSGDFEKFFLGTTLGFNRMSIEGIEQFFGLITSLKAGYKLLMLSRNISIEPSMSFVLSKYSGWGVPTPLGWQGGLRLGYVF